MSTTFDLRGFEQFKVIGERLKKDVQKQIDLASKTAVNKSIDLLAYGKVTGISAKSSSAKGIVAKAASKLRIPVEHIYYRSFVAGIKVTAGKGRGIKPYASLMIRGNDIVMSDLLLSGSDAKGMYGYQTRKKRVAGKRRPNMKAKAAAARGKGGITIAGRNYRNSYLADGSYRNSGKKVGKLTMNEYYMEKLGAKAMQLKGRQMLLFQKEGGARQKSPYPIKVVKIRKQSVMNALNASANSAISGLNRDIDNILRRELKRRMKKIGIELK